MKKEKRTNKSLFYIILILLVISIIFNIYFIKNLFSMNLLKEKQYSLGEYTPVKLSLTQEQIILNNDCYTIVMSTTPEQIQSIANGIFNKTDFRPYSHDTLRNILKSFDIKVLMVKIDDLKENTYYATMFVEQDNKVLKLDSRPSDAIAIAVRFNAPIYVKNSLLQNYGINSC